MRKNTDKKGHGLLGGAIGAALVVGIVLVMLAFLIQVLGPAFPYLRELGAGLGILLVYIGALIAVGVGVVAALFQRWKEVKSGEEDEARKY